MSTRKFFLAASVAVLAAAAFPAAADRTFARSQGCLACHDTDTRIVGPSFKEIAAKYKGEKDGAAQMVASILKGSKGKWGGTEMPPNKVADEDAKKLAEWILSQ
jgi:cytochrome c